MKAVRTGLLAATLVAGVAGMASAAPLGGIGDTGMAIKTEAGKNIDNVTWTCWWHRGHKHCGLLRPRHLGFYYGPPRHYRSWYSWRRW